MINVTLDALINLCKAYHISDSDLTFLGGGQEYSDGIVYSYSLNNQKKVLKVLGWDKSDGTALQEVDERLAFVNYLGSKGINISYPERNCEDKLYASFEDENHIYIAYSMNFCEGENPKTELLTTDLSYHWGKLIGKANRVTKEYPIWKNIHVKPSEYGYMDEINFFTGWCKDDYVKSKWQEMHQTFSKLPIDRNSYGFIHNDNHQHNIFVKDNQITMIDFDVAGCQFFLRDIVSPVQGIMFDLSGGMSNKVYDREPIKRYFDQYINGYETENHIDDFWLGQIDLFINYRRLLLYTCMQDYLDQNTELKNGFISMMKESPIIYDCL